MIVTFEKKGIFKYSWVSLIFNFIYNVTHFKNIFFMKSGSIYERHLEKKNSIKV